VKFLRDFTKRKGVKAKIIDTEKAQNKYLISLIEKELETEDVSREEIMEVLRK
jgi:hypothetical protein